jgi:hypothetical protein
MIPAMVRATILVLLAACGASPPPAQKLPETATPVSSAAPPATGASTSAAPEPPPQRALPDVDVINLCHDVALLAYGEPPNMKDLGRFIGDGGEGKAPRERDGTLAVALVDDKGTTLANVVVTRRMKKLEIGRSCRTLYAH